MNTEIYTIIEGLNSAQKQAVEQFEGPSLIVAGAGSGKTKVLTCRIANVLSHGFDPGSILALTFTNKASKEMKERIAQIVGHKRARALWMGTFHSIFIRFLREDAELLGYPKTFTVYDTSDSRSAIKLCIKELNLDDKMYKPNEVQSRISLAKNSLITAAAYMRDNSLIQRDVDAKKPKICDIYALYEKKCKLAGAMDFDDILVNTNILLRDFPDVLQKYRERFKFILVDEYQDTNFSQYIIVKKLSAIHRNVCVVGDDAQSIYAFRGAKIENILNFRKDYPEAKEFKLEQNYRSTQTIVNAANSLIAKNSMQLKKDCFSAGEEGEKIEIVKAYTELEEAFLVAGSIASRSYSEKAIYSDFAVLYRTNAQSRAVEEALRKRGIPYKIYGGHSFYERAEVKDVMAYLRLVVNPKDNEAFKRIVNVPARGIGDTTVGNLQAAASSADVSIWEAIHTGDLASFGIKSAAANRLADFCRIIGEMSAKATSVNAYDLATEVLIRTGYMEYLKSDNSVEGQSRLENVEELFNSIKNYLEEIEAEALEDAAYASDEDSGAGATSSSKSESISNSSVISSSTSNSGSESSKVDSVLKKTVLMSDFLENISLMSAVDESSKDEDNNKVSLMTVHSSKGLEFKYVYIIGMEEKLFPSTNSSSTDTEIEEERRLFYVAITRAKRALTLSFCQTRQRWGSSESNPPSRFLREIDRKYLDKPLEKEDFMGGGLSSSFGSSNRFGSSSDRYDSGSGGRYDSGNGGRYDSGSGGRYDSGNGGRYDSGTGGRYDSGSGGRYDSGSGGRYDSGSSGDRFGNSGFQRKPQTPASGRPLPSSTQSSPGVSRSSSHGSSSTSSHGSLSTSSPRTSTPSSSGSSMPSSHGNSPQIRRPIENFEADPVSALKVGQTVEHDRFGIGTLVAMDGDLANLKAIVDFQDGGRKTLLLKFAKLRVVK
ncbi:MAG: 3'-5' exonuclease [Bacteroidales bacterium]